MDDNIALLIGIISAGGIVIGQAAEGALHHYSHSKLERTLGEERLAEVSARLKNFDRHVFSLALFNALLIVVFVFSVLWEPKAGVSILSWGHLLRLEALIVFGFVGLVRTITQRSPERVVLRMLGVYRWVDWLMTPVVLPLEMLGRIVGHSIGADKELSDEEDAVEEILDAVSEGEAEGVLEEDAADFIENIMESRDRVVREIMTPRTSLICLKDEIGLDEAVETLNEHGHSRLPVYKDSRDDIVGVLYFKDVLKYLKELQSGERTLNSILREPLFVPETKKINELLKELQDQSVHIAVVLDEFGGTAGLVTLEDILEEFVGELRDEFDQNEVEGISQVDENLVEVEAQMSIDLLNEKLALEIPETSEYDTVGGFLASHLGKVPAEGEHLELDGIHFEVIEADRRRAKRVRLTIPTSPAESSD